jgi:hypothetical protein
VRSSDRDRETDASFQHTRLDVLPFQVYGFGMHVFMCWMHASSGGLMTPSRSDTSAASIPEHEARHLRLAAWALNRAVDRASSSATIQEGLCNAYKRDLCWLLDLDYVPADVRVALSEVIANIRSGLGFNRLGEKKAPSRLSSREARAILVTLQEIRTQAASATRPA